MVCGQKNVRESFVLFLKTGTRTARATTSDAGTRKKRKGVEIRAPEFKQEIIDGRKGASAHYDERGESHKKRWR